MTQRLKRKSVLSAVLLLTVAVPLLATRAARAQLGSAVDVTGKVSDFDAHYVYLESRTERYRIERGAVSDSVELRPGAIVTLEIPFKSFRIMPPTAPANLPQTPYKAPRKRVPAEE